MRQRHSHLRVAILAVSVLSGIAHSQEVADQRNDPTTSISFSCGTPPILNASILQSFVPTQSNLSAVDLRLRAGIAFPSTDVTTTARIRAGSPTGTVLGESSAVVSGGQVHLAESVVRFEFQGLNLTPGETYLIEWDTPASATLTWMGASDADHYPAGTAYTCVGSVWPGSNTDFSFTTYATVASSPCQRIERLADLVEDSSSGPGAACLHRMLATACKSVKRGRSGLAMLKLEIFRHKVYFLVCTRRIDFAAGEQLMREARSIQTEVRETFPRKRTYRKKKRGHRRR